MRTGRLDINSRRNRSQRYVAETKSHHKHSTWRETILFSSCETNFAGFLLEYDVPSCEQYMILSQLLDCLQPLYLSLPAPTSSRFRFCGRVQSSRHFFRAITLLHVTACPYNMAPRLSAPYQRAHRSM